MDRYGPVVDSLWTRCGSVVDSLWTRCGLISLFTIPALATKRHSVRVFENSYMDSGDIFDDFSHLSRSRRFRAKCVLFFIHVYDFVM